MLKRFKSLEIRAESDYHFLLPPFMPFVGLLITWVPPRIAIVYLPRNLA